MLGKTVSRHVNEVQGKYYLERSVTFSMYLDGNRSYEVMFCLQPEELYPPVELLQHPPLATFTNSVLTAFNGLRHCVPLSLVSAVTDSVQSALKAIIQTTCTFHR